jgi:hypothetical protein
MQPLSARIKQDTCIIQAQKPASAYTAPFFTELLEKTIFYLDRKVGVIVILLAVLFLVISKLCSGSPISHGCH